MHLDADARAMKSKRGENVTQTQPLILPTVNTTTTTTTTTTAAAAAATATKNGMHLQRYTYSANQIGIACFGAALSRGQGDRERIVMALHLMAVEQGGKRTPAARRNDAMYGSFCRRSCKICSDCELPEDVVVLFFTNARAQAIALARTWRE
jgi:hypothetical protein